MRRTLFVVAGVALAAVAARAAHRRRASQPELEPGPDPAEELRKSLDATRDGEGDLSDANRPSLEERRARVHEKAQEAIDLMGEPGNE